MTVECAALNSTSSLLKLRKHYGRGDKRMYDTKDREKSFKMLVILRSLSLPAELLAVDGFLR